jgi:hypothetical protein
MRWAYAEMYLLAGQHPQGRQADQSMELGPYITTILKGNKHLFSHNFDFVF